MKSIKINIGAVLGKNFVYNDLKVSHYIVAKKGEEILLFKAAAVLSVSATRRVVKFLLAMNQKKERLVAMMARLIARQDRTWGVKRALVNEQYLRLCLICDKLDFDPREIVRAAEALNGYPPKATPLAVTHEQIEEELARITENLDAAAVSIANWDPAWGDYTAHIKAAEGQQELAHELQEAAEKGAA